MNTNNNYAPEKIYLEEEYPNNGVLPNGLNYSPSPNDIEYTRTDAFIEKAALWLEDNMRKWFKNMNTHGLRMTGLMVDEFKKAML